MLRSLTVRDQNHPFICKESFSGTTSVAIFDVQKGTTMKNTNTNQTVRFLQIVLIGLLISILPSEIQAQTAYKQTDDSYITVAGTSTLHAWTMTSKDTQYQATFEHGPDGAPAQLKALSLNIPSQSLKSEHTAMDKNAYSSLKTDKYKTINFSLTTSSVEKNIIKCSGNLTIAGVTKLINVDANCQVKPDMSMRCTGSKAFKMSDFQIEPPSFMFGTVKTGDEITISFNADLAPIKN
jgi:polyisoprenoid-binding protein YceI